MMTKILLTLTVIIAAIIALRARHQANSSPSSQKQEVLLNPNAEELSKLLERDEQRKKIWTLAIATCVLTLGLSIYFMYEHWQEEHEILAVTVISENNKQQTYHAYRKDVSESRFMTIDGREIRPSDRDRIELQRLP